MAKSPTPLGWTTCAAQGTRPPSLIVLMSLSMIVILAKGLESSVTILVGYIAMILGKWLGRVFRCSSIVLH